MQSLCKNSSPSAKARKKYLKKMRDNGFELYQTWVHKNDKQRLKDFALKLRKIRESIS